MAETAYTATDPKTIPPAVFQKEKRREVKSLVEDMKEIFPTKPNVPIYGSHPYIYMRITDQHLDHKL